MQSLPVLELDGDLSESAGSLRKEMNMDILPILLPLIEKSPLAAAIALVLGTLVVLGQVVVPLTPSTKDDDAWAKLLAVPVLGKVLLALVAFAPIQKK